MVDFFKKNTSTNFAIPSSFSFRFILGYYTPQNFLALNACEGWKTHSRCDTYRVYSSLLSVSSKDCDQSAVIRNSVIRKTLKKVENIEPSSLGQA